MRYWVFMLAAFLGFEVDPPRLPLLHTPLMSLTNAISAIAVVGAILIKGAKDASPLTRTLGFIAVVASTSQRGQRLSHYRPHAQDVQETRAGETLMNSLFPAFYILAAAGFILAIKWMSSPSTARRGVIVGEIGMLLAVVGTLLRFEVVNYAWIVIAFSGRFRHRRADRVHDAHDRCSAADRRFHACGALASALIGTAEYYRHTPNGFVMGALVLETLLGFLTCIASLMAFGKLQEILPTRAHDVQGPKHCQSRRFWFSRRNGHCPHRIAATHLDLSPFRALAFVDFRRSP